MTYQYVNRRVNYIGKSLEFVKERIASGQCNGMENNKYESMIEQDIREYLRLLLTPKMKQF